MQFVITAYDGADMLAKRMKVRPLHLEGMERLKNTSFVQEDCSMIPVI